MEQHYETTTDAWRGTLERIRQLGTLTSPRGQATLEMPGVHTLVIDDPTDFPIRGTTREFRHAITAVEGLSLVGQTSVPELILDRVKSFRPFLNGSLFLGAYGPRVAGDVGRIVDLLKADPDSRQAVLTLYDARRDLMRAGNVDVPCTVSIQFLLRNGLHMWVMMRSNDAWLGLPYDLGQFAMLQCAIAQALGVDMGRYTHSAGSMHLYQRDVDKARDVLLTEDPDGVAMSWGSSDIGEISSRARRLLLGDWDKVPGLTAMEKWLAVQIG